MVDTVGIYREVDLKYNDRPMQENWKGKAPSLSRRRKLLFKIDYGCPQKLRPQNLSYPMTPSYPFPDLVFRKRFLQSNPTTKPLRKYHPYTIYESSSLFFASHKYSTTLKKHLNNASQTCRPIRSQGTRASRPFRRHI